MARDGLLAGLPDPYEGARAPFAAAGAGVAAAAEGGLRAYDRARTMGLQEAQAGREQRRLDMAEQLQPGMVRGQELKNQETQLTLTAAADKMDRETLSRGKMGELLEELRAGKLADPVVFHERLGDAVVAGGDPRHVETWMSHHQALLKDNKLAEDYKGLIGIYAGAMKTSAEKPTDPKVWSDAVSQMLTEKPLAAANSPFMKAAMQHMETVLTNQLPKPVAEAVASYFHIRVADPKKTPAAAWAEAGSALGRTDAQLLKQFTALMPPDVANDVKLQFEGKKAATSAEAKEPSEKRLIAARGEETRKTAAKRYELRDQYAKLDIKALNAERQAVQKELDDARSIMNNQNVRDDDRDRARANHDRAQDALTEIKARLHDLSIGGGATPKPGEAAPAAGEKPTRKPGTPAPGREGQVRQQKISQVRPQIEAALTASKMPRDQRLKQILDHNVQSGEISQAEADYLTRILSQAK